MPLVSSTWSGKTTHFKQKQQKNFKMIFFHSSRSISRPRESRLIEVACSTILEVGRSTVTDSGGLATEAKVRKGWRTEMFSCKGSSFSSASGLFLIISSSDELLDWLSLLEESLGGSANVTEGLKTEFSGSGDFLFRVVNNRKFSHN